MNKLIEIVYIYICKLTDALIWFIVLCVVQNGLIGLL